MKTIPGSRNWSLLLAAMLLMMACSEERSPEPVIPVIPVMPALTDAELQAQIETALQNQSDLPPGLQIAVEDGRATISGSLDCEDCAGQATPGTLGTVQQSVGAVVRAVPGVTDVQFVFSSAP